MSDGLGLFFAMTQPDPRYEEEYNAWYETEGIPSRMKIKGFINGQRMQSVLGAGVPKYMAIYDLEDPHMDQSPQYKAVSYENYSPWTKRMHKKIIDLRRYIYVQRWPGRQVGPEGCPAGYAVGMDFHTPYEPEAMNWLQAECLPALNAVPGVKCARWFTCMNHGPRHLIYCHLEEQQVVLSQEWQSVVKPQHKYVGLVSRLFESVYVPFAYTPS